MTQHEGHGSNLQRKQVKRLIVKRLHAFKRQEMKGQNFMPKSYLLCQDEIVADVLERANGYLDTNSLLAVIDLCILESKACQRAYQARSMKSFFSFREGMLKSLKHYILRRLNPKRWLRRRRK